jgi:Ca2+:H+ antiporter
MTDMLASRIRHARLLTVAFAVAPLLMHWLAPSAHLTVFALSAVAVIPLAGLIGHATTALADRLGAGLGGLLNATFGNAAELIIGIFALRAGLPDLVKASITGSIIANLLLVFGAAALFGGLRHHMLRFNRSAASLGSTMLLLSAIGLFVPAVFHVLARQAGAGAELRLDTEIAGILFITYGLSLVFTLRTHRQLYAGRPTEAARREDRHGSIRNPLIELGAGGAAVAVVSELLVEHVSEAAIGIGLSQLFVGVIVVAIVGNAAEHYSAVTLARDDRMDAAIGIAVGSSQQIALFVAPALLFLSYVLGPHPMDLLFTPFEVVAVGIAVVSISFVAHDGETHWMEGAQLLAVYAILAIAFYFLPGP